MNQFLLFGGDVYYAAGGWNDLMSSHATIDSAKQAALELVEEDFAGMWWHIVNTQTIPPTIVENYQSAQT